MSVLHVLHTFSPIGWYADHTLLRFTALHIALAQTKVTYFRPTMFIIIFARNELVLVVFSRAKLKWPLELNFNRYIMVDY